MSLYMTPQGPQQLQVVEVGKVLRFIFISQFFAVSVLTSEQVCWENWGMLLTCPPTLVRCLCCCSYLWQLPVLSCLPCLCHFLLFLFQKNPVKMWKGPMKQLVMLRNLPRSKTVQGTRTRINGQVCFCDLAEVLFGPPFSSNPGRGGGKTRKQWSTQPFLLTTMWQCQCDTSVTLCEGSQ